MKRSVVFLTVIAVFLTQDLRAATYADTVLQFTGATRVIFTFERYQWCDVNYNPTGSIYVDASTKWSIATYDTKDNAVHILNTPMIDMAYTWTGSHIDRSGKWVVWPDATTRVCKIRDVGATSAERTLISGQTFWTPVCFGYEAASNTQYLYVLDNYDPVCLTNQSNCCWCSTNSKAYKIPFSSADGTVNINGRIDLGFVPGGDRTKLGISSVSADGKYVACNFPWPNTELFSTVTKTYINRHDPQEGFGCEPHVAPDNSYRFFHCMGDHQGIYVFPDLSSTSDNWVYLYKPVPLPGCSDTMYNTFNTPQWSNNPQFLSNTTGGESDGYAGPTGNFDANWVKNTMQMKYKVSCILQKFTPDFKGIAANIFAAPDRRCIDKLLDTWMDNGVVTPGSGTGLGSARTGSQRMAGIRFAAGAGSTVSVIAQPNVQMTVSVTDVRGRLVSQSTGRGTVSLDAHRLSAGVYTISAWSGANSIARSLTIAQ